MKLRLILSALALTAVQTGALAQDAAPFAERLLKAYPQARLMDLYKSAFQDFMGPEHLAIDSTRAASYLTKELAETDPDDLQQWYYEPCGTDGRYVRVSLRAVQERVVTADELLSAFLRSANALERPSVAAWRARWQAIKAQLDGLNLSLPDYAADARRIDSLLAGGHYATSHSAAYREAYKPHYRLVERGIFERELRPRLERFQQADANGYIVSDGDPCPDFTLRLTDGRKVCSGDFRGKVVMLQFTASWCGVCRREMPFIERDIWQRHKDNPDFVLIAIDRDEPLEKVLPFISATGVTYPVALDPGADVYALFALRNSGITRNVLIGRDGTIVKRTRLFNEAEFQSLVNAIDTALSH